MRSCPGMRCLKCIGACYSETPWRSRLASCWKAWKGLDGPESFSIVALCSWPADLLFTFMAFSMRSCFAIATAMACLQIHVLNFATYTFEILDFFVDLYLLRIYVLCTRKLFAQVA